MDEHVCEIYSEFFCTFSAAYGGMAADPKWQIKKIHLFFYGTGVCDRYPAAVFFSFW